MRLRGPRFGIRGTARFYRVDELVEAEISDVSLRGAFVHTDRWLPVNGEVDLLLDFDDGTQVQVASRVAHCLRPERAHESGRRGGMGFALLAGSDAYHFRRYVQQLGRRTPEPRLRAGSRILLLTHSDALAQRVDNAMMGHSAYLVCVRSMEEALELAASDAWDAALIDAQLGEAALAGYLSGGLLRQPVPVMVVGEAGDEHARLELYRAGVRDCLPVPFTDEELLRRLSPLLERIEAADLRARLERFEMGSVLSLLGHERRSGVLSVQGPTFSIHVALSDGEVRQVSHPPQLTEREALQQAMRWKRGQVAFRERTVPRAGPGRPISQLLLELARQHDESRWGE